MDNQEVLRLPFDVARHKETFINHLKVVIFPDGRIEYASQRETAGHYRATTWNLQG